MEIIGDVNSIKQLFFFQPQHLIWRFLNDYLVLQPVLHVNFLYKLGFSCVVRQDQRRRFDENLFGKLCMVECYNGCWLILGTLYNSTV